MSNFTFLQPEWQSLFKKMKRAEERVYSEPISTAYYCRLALEESIHLLYEIEKIRHPYNDSLINLMTHEEVKQNIPFHHLKGLHIARKTGNNAVHYGRKVNKKDALISIKYLFGFLKWFAANYSKVSPSLPSSFDSTHIPKIGAAKTKLKALRLENEEAQASLKTQIARLMEANAINLEKAQENKQALEAHLAKETKAKQAIQAQKKERLVHIDTEFTEAETRQHLIDIDLQEAGWDELVEGRELEFPVKGMPVNADNPNGNGFVDYVLWDDNGKPLAIIEAKRTTVDIETGKHQAYLYANCLEEMYNQRPIIFYTNGYEIKIWEDAFYSTPRRVYGYYHKEQLQWMIQRGKTRKDIRKTKVNTAIAGRPYQTEAIQRVSESFVTDGKKGLRGSKRNALLVMAAGSGKTRTSAALAELFIKNNWVKRVLFLADKNTLVRQAKKSFEELIPEFSSINLSEEKETDTTSLVFSTYPNMMNRIDNIRNENERFYGVGHFDMIIVDEAHRSVYSQFGAIFEYFDAMVIGLTATPKDSIDHKTFELFDCSNDDPTFSYELDEAVPTYLNPYKSIDISTDFLREGIKYPQLSDEEKEIYEDVFEDRTTGLFPEEIDANAMNKWLFNKDTVNKVLDAFMTNGLKIEDGTKIGRTIIFAVNQKHAEFIVHCFTESYPDKPSGFISMIHNKVSHVQSLIDDFCDEFKEKNPQIAVSVDMMDTGIDAHRVLNLVFFKVVRSYSKFWQMIGRGTRLCPDVFGPNQPKDHFLIFDVCQNFDYFEINKKHKEGSTGKPLSQQIFESKLQISTLLAETGEKENLSLSKKLLDLLHKSIEELDRNRFQVDMHIRYVEKFKKRKRWNKLTADDIHQIEKYLSDLPSPDTNNNPASRFDLMMLKLQISNLLKLSSEKGYQKNLMSTAEELSKKYSIPQVLSAKHTIEELKNPNFYIKLSQNRLDKVREELRDLIQFLGHDTQISLYTNIIDSEVTLTVGKS